VPVTRASGKSSGVYFRWAANPRTWLRVIWACWHTNTPYHPHAHLAEQRLAAA
jgi:hypothetical protein